MEPSRIISSEFLEPATKLQNPPRLNLTAFDNGLARVPYQQRILFYSSTQIGNSFEDFLRLLKRSLSEVLVVFYPFAGRILTLGATESVLDCSLGQNVMFSQAVTSSTLAELGQFSPSEFCNSLCDLGAQPPSYPWTADNPLLFIQVTRFGCGGASLGFAFSHNLVDGTSAWHFVTSWSEMARTGQIKTAPDITYGYKALELTDEEAAQVESRLKFSDIDSNDVNDVRNASQTRLVTRTYTLEPEVIEKLKSRATAETNGLKLSSFVVISAFIWRKVTIARQLQESSKSRFITIVNCRGRNPSISKSYFGNAVSVTFTVMEAGEIRRNGFWHCAARLHESIASFSHEKADETMGYFRWLARNEQLGKVMRGFSTNIVHAIGSPRHPVYETDFGFGKPIGVTFGTNDLGDGKVYLFPSAKGDGGVAVTVVLKSDDMERLSLDEEEI